MKRGLITIFGATVVLFLISGSIVFAFRYKSQLRNFKVVHDGVLYRSGKLSINGIKRVVHDYGIRTIVSLKEDGGDPINQEFTRQEADLCGRLGVMFVHLPPKPWSPLPSPPVETNVEKFLKVLSDPNNHPVLVHCHAGIHRTGAYCALFRMEYEGVPNASAMAELKLNGYDNLDVELDIRGYLENFTPRGYGTKLGPISNP